MGLWEIPINQLELWLDFFIETKQEDARNEIKPEDWIPHPEPGYVGFFYQDFAHNLNALSGSEEIIFHLNDFDTKEPVEAHEIQSLTKDTARIIVDANTYHLEMLSHAVVAAIRPLTGLMTDDMVVQFKKYNDTTWSILTLDTENFRETGDGWYQVKLLSTQLDTPGQLIVIIKSTDDSPVKFQSQQEIRIVPQETSPTGQVVDIKVMDQNSVPVDGAEVAIYDETDTKYLFRQVTDFSGDCRFYLTPGSYKVRIMRPLHDFNNPEDLIVPTGGGQFEYVGISYIATFPELPDTCNLFGTILDVDGNPKRNVPIIAQSVQKNTNAIIGSNGVAVSTTTVPTDEDGRFEMSLIRGVTVKLVIQEMQLSVSRVVPDQALIELKDFIS